ncbi:MAG: hypothetical protein ACR2FM_04515 [Candidatus Saccharimonadales bacterium]
MNSYVKHRYAIALGICTVGLGTFLTFTNPSQVSIGLLVVPVLLLFFIAFSAFQVGMDKLKLLKTRPRKRRTVALTGASIITVVMILQSTGGISTADALLMALIVLAATVYINKF